MILYYQCLLFAPNQSTSTFSSSSCLLADGAKINARRRPISRLSSESCTHHPGRPKKQISWLALCLVEPFFRYFWRRCHLKMEKIDEIVVGERKDGTVKWVKQVCFRLETSKCSERILRRTVGLGSSETNSQLHCSVYFSIVHQQFVP